MKDSNIQESGRRRVTAKEIKKEQSKKEGKLGMFLGTGRWSGYENLQKREWPTTPVMPKYRTEIFVKMISAEKSS